MSKFSIIIPSRMVSNLQPCVQAIRSMGETARIIVIDDGLDFNDWPCQGLVTDDLAGLNVHLIEGKKPFNFSTAINMGIEACEEADVVLLNDDALLRTPNGLSLLSDFAQAHPEIGCIAPATNVTGNPEQWPERRPVEGWKTVGTLPYICVYLTRNTLNTVGLLDERYNRDYGVQDADHIEAMRRKGLSCAVVYDVFVDHGSLRSTYRGDPRAPKDFSQNQQLFNEKWLAKESA